MNQKIQSPEMLKSIGAVYLAQQAGFTRRVLVCGGAGCVSCHCQEVKDALDASLSALDLTDQVQVLVTGCIGLCAAGPILVVEPEGVLYTNMTPERVAEVAQTHLLEGNILEEYTYLDQQHNVHIPHLKDIGFFQKQVRIALRTCGQMDFERRLPGAGERIVQRHAGTGSR